MPSAALDAQVRLLYDPMLMKAHISASRTEIRHITLHRLALAASGERNAG